MIARTDTLERLVPEQLEPDDATGRDTLALHVARYELAAKHARGRVLDLACGAGYGTRLVADRAAAVTDALGVDISADAVRYAEAHYARPGVAYRCADAETFTEPGGFDTAISLETIEHVPHPERVVARLAGALRPGGVLIASVPTTPSVDVNPHHLHDFTETSFRAMVERAAGRALDEIDALRQIQPYPIISILRRTEKRLADMRPNLPRYYARHPRAAARRLAATLRYGFTNRYITIAWRARVGAPRA